MAVDCSHTPLLAFVQSKQAIGSGVSLPDSESSSRLIVIHFLVLKLSEHSQHWSTLVVLCIVLHLRQLCSDHFFSLGKAGKATHHMVLFYMRIQAIFLTQPVKYGVFPYLRRIQGRTIFLV
ncbi:unnamed protein product [Cuscuta epithymum]|uniref:Uncharacterized protein n=1 Tax=Cuscuta epithymum TaxID=186058 RepID=A0AAV0DBK8_9ASTE|nr:unnamed protein product [Cuscuta epithymum]